MRCESHGRPDTAWRVGFERRENYRGKPPLLVGGSTRRMDGDARVFGLIEECRTPTTIPVLRHQCCDHRETPEGIERSVSIAHT